MSEASVDPFVFVIPSMPETLPPKDGLLVAVALRHSLRTCYIWWDAAWGGGRGGWFTSTNQAVAENAIIGWERRIPQAQSHWVVSRMNELLLEDRAAKLAKTNS